MILKKTYYSISEVSKMLNIQEHTIRFWDSKVPDLSKTNYYKSNQLNLSDSAKKRNDSKLNHQKFHKIRTISNNLKNLIS